tara:strand:- start:795 stop:941 length:147 start_codon:yes stop_codon:yes gene_type:complete
VHFAEFCQRIAEVFARTPVDQDKAEVIRGEDVDLGRRLLDDFSQTIHA